MPTLDRGNPQRPITRFQREFLNECFSSDRCLADIMEDWNITPERFAGWLSKRNFTYHLNRMVRVLSKRRELDIARGGALGAEMLHRHADGSYWTRKKRGRAAAAANSTDTKGKSEPPKPQPSAGDLEERPAERHKAWVSLARLAREWERHCQMMRRMDWSSSRQRTLDTHIAHPDLPAEEVRRLVYEMTRGEVPTRPPMPPHLSTPVVGLPPVKDVQE